LEQWTGFRGAVSGCLSYGHDTNLRRVKWYTGAGIISTKKGIGMVTSYMDEGKPMQNPQTGEIFVSE
jgi:hypothetical protein